MFYQSWVCPADTGEQPGGFEWPLGPSLTTGPHSGLFPDQDTMGIISTSGLAFQGNQVKAKHSSQRNVDDALMTEGTENLNLKREERENLLNII